MRATLALVLSACALVACKFDPLPQISGDGGGGPGDDGGPGSDACTGLACQVASCPQNMETRVLGTVFLPNGMTPLANADIYVPSRDPGPIEHGAMCANCGPLPGDPITRVRSDSAGRFVLRNIPSGADIPVVITAGKWRRQLRLAQVDDCTETVLATDVSRLPRSRADMTPPTTSVDLPTIAVSTGQADALECLVRKIGIADSEFGTVGSPAAVHLFSPGVNGGARMGPFGVFASSTTALWGSFTTLAPYDLVMLSCEGVVDASTKPASALAAMKSYADAGGRIWAEHQHNLWIDGLPASGLTQPEWETIADFSPNSMNLPAGDILIDTANPAGMDFATWQQNVSGIAAGRIPMPNGEGRTTAISVDMTRAIRWAYFILSGMMRPQNFMFTTPVTPGQNRCGRVAFSDMHVSASSMSQSNQPFPAGCSNAPMTAQELAMAYLLFELQSCVPL
ncbi:MAG: hypothetical protein ACKV2T_11450 [Kofleriaceae bacterium]